MNQRFAIACVGVLCVWVVLAGCESRSDIASRESSVSNDPLSPDIRLVAFQLKTTPADGGNRISVGKPFHIDGMIWSADSLESAKLSVSVLQIVEGRGLRRLYSERVELEEESSHLYAYGLLMDALGKAGPHCIRVVYKGEVLDEHVLLIHK
ncbi:MAG: hypothetical protein R3C20_14935 [Planctomycetaceae bacterium]